MPTEYPTTRTCICGMATDQPELCDACTGNYRPVCPVCVRTHWGRCLKNDVHVVVRHKDNHGNWCKGAGCELEMLN